jgi:outer membrane protein assembly factor BamA
MRMPFEAGLDSNALALTKFVEMSAKSQSVTLDTAGGAGSRMTVVTPLAGYGDVRIDMADALPSGSQSGKVGGGKNSAANDLAPPADARTSSGEFKIADYKVKITPDFIMATGNYTSFYGIQGVTQMLFSDMLGNHQLFIASDLLLDLKNSSFLVSYEYLPQKIDYGVDLFQSSQLYQILTGNNTVADVRYRQYGLSLRASDPFDRFTRLDFGLTGMYVTRETIVTGEGGSLPNQSRPIIYPSISYVYDNSSAWAFGPVRGTRYIVTAQASPKLGSNGVGFSTVMGDFRHYMPLGWGEYSIATRLTGGASFGPNPQKFALGGVSSWLNWDYANGHNPVINAEDFTFVTTPFPLRGFDYYDQYGSKYFLGNLEVRFPLFVGYPGSGILTTLFQYVSGTLFLDVGSAWNGTFHATKLDDRGISVTDDLRIGTGIGARAYVFGIPFRLDVAWNYNLNSWSRPKYYISLGYDF